MNATIEFDEYTALNSSQLDSAYWAADAIDEARGIVYVNFRNGNQYAYFDVPRHVFEGLSNAPSPGSFYNKNLRGVYSGQRGDYLFVRRNDVGFTLSNEKPKKAEFAIEFTLDATIAWSGTDILNAIDTFREDFLNNFNGTVSVKGIKQIG